MGQQHSYDAWGRGELPVLLLHGFTGDRTSWDHLRPRLETRVRALAVDLPGHGRSGLPVETGRAGFEETVDSLADLVGQAVQGCVDVIGYSQGARLALGLAVRWPRRVRRLVLESGSPGLSAPKLRGARRREDSALADRLREQGIELFIEQWARRPIFNGLRKLPPPLAGALRARRLAQSAKGLAGALLCLGSGVQPNYWPALPLVRAPTLLLTGSVDEKFTRVAREMAAQLPMGWLRVFEGSGHAPHLEAPDAYASEVLGFLGTPWFDAPCAPANEMEECG